MVLLPFLIGVFLTYLSVLVLQQWSLKNTFGDYIYKSKRIEDILENEKVIVSRKNKIITFPSDFEVEFVSRIKKPIPDYIFGRNEFWYVCFNIDRKENYRAYPDSDLHEVLEEKWNHKFNN